LFLSREQVVVFQEYYNDSESTVEAKYVFPLDEFAVVCGFEAFINGKHVVGVVKEKETAHREYKQAVSKGHGAYLMDQDKESPVGGGRTQSTVMFCITTFQPAGCVPSISLR
jgi:Vault protein inter-alpha-trypsin domain